MPPTIATKSFVFRFADVTVREREFAIGKAGQVQQVEPKAFRVLLMLIRNPNKLITKEELLTWVWGDTAVTENSLARNIALIRRLLGDDPREPRFIETVSGIGYRFLCPVEATEEPAGNLDITRNEDLRSPNGWTAQPANGGIGSGADTCPPRSSASVATDSSPLQREPESLQQQARARTDQKRWPVTAAIGVLVVPLAIVSLVLLFAWHRTPVASPARWEQITNFPDSATSPAFSPDGKMIAFIRGWGTFSMRGHQIYVKMLPDGEPVQLTHDDLFKSDPAFSPDGSRVAYTTAGTTFQWNSWVVPVLKGEPRQFLPNAGSVTWIDRDHVVFSEIKTGVHMGIATASESRAGERDVYLPASSEGMAHRSWVSPDRKWILVSEMEDIKWQPCRLLPFDGTSSGYAVGPKNAPCVSAAWSPDGKTMYFSADAGDGYHIWRQRFPRGATRQLTFGPTGEEGIAVSPDGRQLITSAGVMQSTVWVHDSRGDRPVSGEGFASLPGLGATNHPWADSVFSADGKRLFYLLGQRVPRQFGSGQLWVADLDSGRTEAVIPGVLVTEFDIAPDGQRVTFETQDENGARNAWLAPLDRSSPPQRLAGSVALMPHFAADGNVYMFVPEGGQRFLYKVGADRIARKLGPISGNFIGLSPRGDWLIEGYDPVTARPVRGGVSIPVCRCSLAWGPDSKFLYLRFQDYGGLGGGRTIAIGLPPDKELPVLPPSGLKSAKDVKGLKVVGDIDMTGLGYFVPGPNPSIYAYTKVTVLRNLFRIPID